MVKKILSKIKEKIKKFRQPVVIEQYTQISHPEQLKEFESTLLKKIGELEGELERLREENERLQKTLAEVYQQMEAEEEQLIRLQEEEIKRLRKENSVRIYFKFPKPVQIRSAIRAKPFLGDDGTKYLYWRGIELENTKYGIAVNLLLSRKPRDKVIGVLEGPPWRYFTKLFPDDTLVDDIKTGRIFINMTPDGKFIVPQIEIPEEEPQYETNGGETIENGGVSDEFERKLRRSINRLKRIDLHHLLQTKDPEVVEIITNLWSQIQRLQSEKRLALESEKKEILSRIDAEIAAKVNEAAMDRATSMLSEALSRLDVAYDKLLSTRVRLESAQLQQALSDMITEKLWLVIDRVLDKIAELGIEPKEKLREEFQEEVRFAARQIVESINVAKGLVTAATKTPAEEVGE